MHKETFTSATIEGGWEGERGRKAGRGWIDRW